MAAFFDGLGAILFGIVIGWMAYRILRLRAGFPGLSDIIAILGAVGGAAALAIVKSDVFGWYAIGLVIGFFAYLAVGVVLYGKEEVLPWRPEQIQPTATPDTQPSADKD